MLLESACIPIPSEATMLFAGFNVSDGHWSLIEITLVGTAGNLVGSWIAYAVGYFGRVELLEQHGRKIHVTPARLQQADRWFERWGAPAVFFSRLLPVVRTFISLPAGVARMTVVKFSLLTVAGCLPWVLALGFIGKEARDNWTTGRTACTTSTTRCSRRSSSLLAYYGIRWWRRGRAAEPATDASSS